MKLKVLEYFIALAESRSINEAAQRLYIAQPSLTKALQLLEAEIGVPLFSRTKSGIVLTQAGETILPQARQMVEYYRGWLRLSEQRVLRSLDIYVHISLSGFLMPDIVLQFRKARPGLRINCVTVANPEDYLSRDTQRPVLALTLCSEEEADQKLIRLQDNEALVLCEGMYGCLVSKNSRLAQRSAVTFQDLKDFYLVLPEYEALMNSPSSISPILNDITAAISPGQIIPVDSVGSVIDLLSKRPETFALSYYPALNRYHGVPDQELVYLPFQSRETRRRLCLIYSKQAYAQYLGMREFVAAVHTSFTQFLSECEGALSPKQPEDRREFL